MHREFVAKTGVTWMGHRDFWNTLVNLRKSGKLDTGKGRGKDQP